MKLLLLILTITIAQITLAQPGSYSEVPSSQYNDARLQAALHFGANNVTQEGIKSGRLPNSTFEVTQIFSVQKQVVNGLNYKFDVELSNGQMTVRAKYVVYSQAGSGDLKVTDSWFDITSASNNLLPIIIWPPVEPIEYVDEEGEPEEEEGEPVEEGGKLGGYSPVAIETLNTDPYLREILNFGFQDFITGLFDAGYFIEDVLSIETQVVSGVNYKFVILLGDDEGNEIPITFTVYDQPWTGTRKVIESEILENEAEEEGEEPNLGGWETVDISELDTNHDLAEILNFGVWFLNALVILPTSDYVPIEVYSIKQQVVAGMNYRFNLELETPEGASATVIIVVYDQSWTGTRKMLSYYFLDIQDAPAEETTQVIDGGAFDEFN